MNWIVSDKTPSVEKTLANRTEFIRDVASAKVTLWRKQICKGDGVFRSSVNFFQCNSEKGEYGFFITAHINMEVQPILRYVLTGKKAIVVINSCALNEKTKAQCLNIVKAKNAVSELYFAKQTIDENGRAINYCDDVGTFGFATTVSERELFQNRSLGLIKAIRTAFEKVV